LPQKEIRMSEMRETMERVALDDFYELRGAKSCFCCPNGISRMNAECISWRTAEAKKTGGSGRHHGAAGRYPVSSKFPCPICGEVKEHWH